MPRTTKTNTKTPRIAPQSEIELLVSRQSTLELRVLALIEELRESKQEVTYLKGELSLLNDRVDTLQIMVTKLVNKLDEKLNPKPKYESKY